MTTLGTCREYPNASSMVFLPEIFRAKVTHERTILGSLLSDLYGVVNLHINL